MDLPARSPALLSDSSTRLCPTLGIGRRQMTLQCQDGESFSADANFNNRDTMLADNRRIPWTASVPVPKLRVLESWLTLDHYLFSPRFCCFLLSLHHLQLQIMDEAKDTAVWWFEMQGLAPF
ncbi:hypothetical protein MGYG_08696 [Nannizzia gypsea CBS 118893]|uniref:Uncharacterized protein n=1 Tax=Arthroderma gypseum (strain ATCC MYA-4604 / CBS 118893) TaxID=535722 RepID=E4V6Q6_ARTGP|nr:hypothetical protein MGYG_08696 [Nannizzia gypsea CBS 118893]EFQ96772.1 hypothetical protein MGYG_08696 [Nannizzia gypsea CBS 118893]